MNPRRWSQGVRLSGGFLLAPAVVPLTLYAALSIATAYHRLDLSGIATDALRMFVLTFGVGMVYLCVLCFGVPYVVLVRKAGRLNFRAVMLPTLLLSWVYSVVVYASLLHDYPFAGTVAALCLPGVILAGLCFYFIGVWKSPQAGTDVSLLLETYSARPKPTLQV
jgi:hypothetical protein